MARNVRLASNYNEGPPGRAALFLGLVNNIFEREDAATIFIGSNNFTDGGFYSNIEASTRLDFKLPCDAHEYSEFLSDLTGVLEPEEDIAQSLTQDLINSLVALGLVPSESEARVRRSHKAGPSFSNKRVLPVNPFGAVGVPRPPLASKLVRDALKRLNKSLVYSISAIGILRALAI